MNPILEHKLLATRRHLLGGMAGGIGAIAMRELLAATNAAPVPALTADLAAWTVVANVILNLDETFMCP